MKLPYHWITGLVPGPHTTPHELARTLTLLGLESELSLGLEPTFGGVIAARVESVRPEGPGTLVTLRGATKSWTAYSTAPGIAPGQIVAFAPPGSTVGGQPVTIATFTSASGLAIDQGCRAALARANASSASATIRLTSTPAGTMSRTRPADWPA